MKTLAFLVPFSLLVAVGGLDPASAAAPAKPADLIAVLKSDARPETKALACKQLAVYGGADAVPALAPLLSNPELASWARIALEAIPGPEADEALRNAIPTVQGKLRVGVINSIGVRRDAKAVSALAEQLKDGDAAVVGAAAVALGSIGGDAAAAALTAALTAAPAAARSEVAEGGVRCAELFLLAGASDKAIKLYDAVRQGPVPKHRALEATRGAILARKSAGLPLLLEQLRSQDKRQVAVGLATARELPGMDVTRALVAELQGSTPERQALLVAALGDRGDPTVLTTLAALAKTSPSKVRLAIVSAAERLNHIASVGVLLDIAVLEDAPAAKAAKTALARLPAQGAETELLARLAPSSGRTRQVLLELVGLRLLTAALPTVVQSAEDADPGVRRAAAATLGAIGTEAHADELVRLLQKATDNRDRAELEKALLVLSARLGTRSLPHLQPLIQSADTGQRKVALHALASVGGPDALSLVRASVASTNQEVQDEAVRTLSTWANNWPDESGVAEPLLALARTGTKDSHRVLALRGYLQYLRGNPKLQGPDKVARIAEVLPLLTTSEARRSAISVISTTPIPKTLEILQAVSQDPAIAEEAYGVTVTLATANDLKQLSKDQRQQALQWALDRSQEDVTRKKAEAALKGLP